MVTPHAGVWIETYPVPHASKSHVVTPHAGVWIETIKHPRHSGILKSHASCRRVD